jgi:hypothetical protein
MAAVTVADTRAVTAAVTRAATRLELEMPIDIGSFFYFNDVTSLISLLSSKHGLMRFGVFGEM